MKTDVLRKKDILELQNDLRDLLRNQFDLRMKKGVSIQQNKFVKSHAFRNTRRMIARIKTIIHWKAQAL